MFCSQRSGMRILCLSFAWKGIDWNFVENQIKDNFLFIKLQQSFLILYSMSIQKLEQTGKSSISCVRFLSAEELFKQSLQNLHSQKYFKQYSNEFAQNIFIFEIKYGKRSWILVKDNKELSTFVKIPEVNTKLSEATRQSLLSQHENKAQDQATVYQDALAQFLTVNPKAFELPFFQYNREGYGSFLMNKRSGGRYRQSVCCKIGSIIKRWKSRRINIYLKGVAYYNQKNQVRQFLSFCQGFHFQFGKPNTGLQFGIILYANHRQLSLQAKNIKQFIYFIFTLRNACKQSSYMSLNRFNSFAPLRCSSSAKFYVDGRQYFQHMADSLLSAKDSVLILGWMVSPEFLLKREKEKVSLEQILEQLSIKNVKVSIIVYQQSCFLSNDSLYTKQKLEKFKNIEVLRHPCGKLPVLWSHHGKMVVIDEQQAFVGGLDLCYGRFDCQDHELFPKNSSTIYPGLQHNNIRKNDQMNVRIPGASNIPMSECRLPWHDVGQSLKGDAVADLVHHFYQLWNFVRYQNRLSPQDSFAPSLFQTTDVKTVFSLKPKPSSQDDQSILKKIQNGIISFKAKSKLVISGLKDEIKKNFEIEESQSQSKLRYSANQDYFQKYIKQVSSEIEQKQKGTLKAAEKKPSKFRNSGSRSKRYSLQQIKEIKQAISKQLPKQNRRERPHSFLLSGGDKILDYMAIQINKDYVECLQRVKKGREVNKEQGYLKQIESDSQDSAVCAIKENSKITSQGRDQCQVVRSVGNWSIGCHSSNTEFSIQIAYLQLISQAKHYIYIQNQFFISSLANQDVLKNQIALALYLRIKKAIQANQNFMVCVILPLIPGFSGNIETEDCLLLRKQMQWQYDTICRGQNSLWQKLLNHTNDPGRYLQFLSLRAHGRFDATSRPQTEIIYVHSKVMIIDDQTIICGSANINDRSLVGDRDSELAIITRGEDFVEGKINGESVLVSQIAQQLRIKLWKQHFAFSEQQLVDPLSKELWQQITERAANNTNLYRRIFACYPDDNMRSRRQMQTIKDESNIQLYDELSKEIVGHVVQFPLCFLEDEPLTCLITQKEFYMPAECLT